MPISTTREIFEVNEIQPQPVTGNVEPNLYGVDLAFAGVDSQYSLHALHPYVASINPPLVNALIETYIPIGESILDPYCGGGGVLLEATLNNRPNSGGDVNPLSIILSKAKTTYIDQTTLRTAFDSVLLNVEQQNIDEKIEIHPQLRFWFKDHTIPVISSLINAINEVTQNNDQLNTLFKAIFSATVRDVMLTYRGEVRLRKLQGIDLDKFNPNVLRSFTKRFEIAFDRIITLPVGAVSNIAMRDIKSLEFADEAFHSIICSPPYADDKNGVGYFQFSKNMLEWMGFSKEYIKEHKNLFLGASKEINPLPASLSLESSLENVRNRDMNHYKEAVSFYYDYFQGLKEMKRVVRNYIIIVIGNRVLSRTQFDNAQITVDFFDQIGVTLKHHYTRELRKKRIANLGGDGGGGSKEHILVFEK